MKHMKKIILFVLGLVAGTTVYAQEVETTVAADVVSQYIWRGQDLGNVSLQPTLGVEYKGLSLSAWMSRLPDLTLKDAISSTMPMERTMCLRQRSVMTSECSPYNGIRTLLATTA